MSRFSISLTLVIALLTGLGAYEQEAEACGVKLAIKTVRQKQRGKQAPVAAKNSPIVNTREARRPIAAGPRVVEAKTATTTAAAPPSPPPTTTPPPVEKTPEKVAVATPPPVEKAPVEKAPDSEKITTPAPRTVETKAPKAPAATSNSLSRETYFGLGSTSLQGKANVDKAAKWLAANPDIKATIDGFADPTGNADDNMTLSRQRAEAVRDYLVASGVDASRLEVRAFGDTQLKYGRTDGRNRRVMIEATK
jgi:outer membrane protein OmpA-like peptidoglycan-associated protein